MAASAAGSADASSSSARCSIDEPTPLERLPDAPLRAPAVLLLLAVARCMAASTMAPDSATSASRKLISDCTSPAPTAAGAPAGDATPLLELVLGAAGPVAGVPPAPPAAAAALVLLEPAAASAARTTSCSASRARCCSTAAQPAAASTRAEGKRGARSPDDDDAAAATPPRADALTDSL